MLNAPTNGIKRIFVETPLAQVHVAIAGTGFPVLLLHQTPRSWDEFRDVLPLLGQDFCAIAMDTPGYGDSGQIRNDKPSIEIWARTAFALLDALEIKEAIVVGHHTGGVIAAEMAAAQPNRVRLLVLSATPFVDAARRAEASKRLVVDDFEAQADGGDLQQLWAARRPYYPADATDLLRRYMIDFLRSHPFAPEGHRIVRRYHMDERLPLIRCPTLVIAPTADPAGKAGPRLVSAIAGSVLREAPGATVPFPDQLPELFARMVRDFARESGIIA